MLAVELIKDQVTKERAPEMRNQLVQECYKRGMLVLGCGANSIRFSPPLIVTTDEVDEALTIFREALAACT
jgi:4-aminobutyrate aminotransferase